MYSYTTYFNALFLVYVALFSASLFALIDLLAHLDPEEVRAAMRPTLPTRVIAGYCALVGLFFLVAWLGQIVPATLQGTVPEPISLARTPTSAVHVQDLAVALPLYFLAAIWLWRRRAWGFVLAPILLILGDLMLLALLAMGAFMAQAGFAGALDMAPLFAGLALVSLALTGVYFANIQSPSASEMPSPPMSTSLSAVGSSRLARAAYRRPRLTKSVAASGRQERVAEERATRCGRYVSKRLAEDPALEGWG
jgi:hypothetical protein